MLKIFAVETDREGRHDAARRLLKWKYEEQWQKPMPDIETGENGKLRFSGGEEHFCFSYCDGLAFCALSDGNLGLDAENVRSVSAAMVSRVLARQEWVVYAESDQPAETFMRFWTLKEAYCKFNGQGIAGSPLKEIVFDLSGDQPVLLGHPELRFWCRSIGGVVISVCADREHRPELYAVEL